MMKNKNKIYKFLKAFGTLGSLSLLFLSCFVSSLTATPPGGGFNPETELSYELQGDGYNFTVNFNWSPPAPPTNGEHGHNEANFVNYLLIVSYHPSVVLPESADSYTMEEFRHGTEFTAYLYGRYDNNQLLRLDWLTFTTPEFYPHREEAEEQSYLSEASLERTLLWRTTTGARSGFVDAPDQRGSDGGKPMFQDGKLYITMGDSLALDFSNSSSVSAEIAWTNMMDPKRFLIGHYHRWFFGRDLLRDSDGNPTDGDDGDNGYPDPQGYPWRGFWEGNSEYFAWPSPCFLTDLPGGGKRFWELVGTNNPTGVALYYTDDERATRVRAIQFIDTGEDALLPHQGAPVYVGGGRIMGDYAYLFIEPVKLDNAGSRANTCILRCPLSLVNNVNMADWHILESFDAAGNPVWSTEGATQPSVFQGGAGDLEPSRGGSVGSTNFAWNAYLNKWITSGYGGPTRDSIFRMPGPLYCPAMDPALDSTDLIYLIPGLRGGSGIKLGPYVADNLMTSNGGMMYYIRSNDGGAGPQPDGERGGTRDLGQAHSIYLIKNPISPILELTISQKCAVASDVVEIYATDNSWPDWDLNIEVTVDGQPAEFVEQIGNTYHYRYYVSGSENGGLPGRVNVEAIASSRYWPYTPNRFHYRSVALVVNHLNDLTCSIISHDNGEYVSGAIDLQTEFGYTGDVNAEVIEEGGPPKDRSAELWIDGNLFHRIVEGPWNFVVNTRELTNGAHMFTVKGYDYLDRRVESNVILNVENTPRVVQGNLLVDGNMETHNLAAWQRYRDDVIIQKVGNGQQREGGARALKLTAGFQGMSTQGVRQTITGLTGGEELTLSVWMRCGGALTATAGVAQVRIWSVDTAEYVLLESYTDNPHHYMKTSFNFTNPADNTALTVYLVITDYPADDPYYDLYGGALLKELWIDDMVLRPTALEQGIEVPQNFTAQGGQDNIVLSWDEPNDVTLEFTEIYRRVAGQPGDAEWTWMPIVRLDRSDFGFYTGFCEDIDVQDGVTYEYRIVQADAMGFRSAEAVTTGTPGAPPITGDFDGDGDVDLDDFALFAQCYAGADRPPAAGCSGDMFEGGFCKADFDQDGDVDLDDFALFAQNFTGAL